MCVEAEVRHVCGGRQYVCVQACACGNAGRGKISSLILPVTGEIN